MKALRNCSVLIFFLIISIGYVHSEIPGVINYQAKLFDENGNALSDGLYSFTFTIFDAPINGNALWQENQDVPVKNGFINAYLGTNTAINIDFNKKLWLEVTIDGNEPFPRTPLSSVPYALNAKNSQIAQTVVDGAITTQKLAPGDDGDVLMTSGSNVVWAPLTNSTSWSLSGNSGTTAGTNFIGTTDNVPFEMRITNGNTKINQLFIGANNEIYRENPNIASWVAGAARGQGAVDLQGYRTDAAQVASGAYSTVGGGFQNSASGTSSTMGGGDLNVASGTYSTVGGGLSNTAKGFVSTVAGGQSNTASGTYSTVGGGLSDTAKGFLSTVAGGQSNTASGNYSTVGGGENNTASGYISTVAGGRANTAIDTCSTVGGGENNTASGNYSTVGGGIHNTAQSYGETVAGLYATVGTGDATAYVATDRLFVIGNGTATDARSDALVMLKNGNLTLNGTITTGTWNGTEIAVANGGTGATTAGAAINNLLPSQTGNSGKFLTTDGTNPSWGDISTVGWGLTGNAGTIADTNFIGTTDNVTFEMRVAKGDTTENQLFIGANNEIYRDNPNVAGWVAGNARGQGAVDLQGYRRDAAQVASGTYSTVGGGEYNTVSGGGSTVGGGVHNTASNIYCTVGGGNSNTSSGDYSTVGGGGLNTASNIYSTVAGGQSNTASGGGSTVGGGVHNTASGINSTVAGGNSNTASGVYSTVGGGGLNTASNINSTVAGGDTNTASGRYSTVAGGIINTASGESSTVAGGGSNTASGYAGTVGGGGSNKASGYISTVGGGHSNTASGYISTVGGGHSNTASGINSTVAGGYYAKADKFGQNAYASGGFANQGDAQTSLFVVRRSTSVAGWTTLYLNGSSQNIFLASSATWTFRILVVGKLTGGTTSGAAYEITGAVTNNGGTATILGTPTVTTVYESNSSYDARVTVSGANLIVQVEGNGDALRWVARVETAEVTW